jgi:hypothetical protein
MRIEKHNGFWEVVDAHAGISQVGERIAKGVKTVINALAEDGSYVDGNVEPRLYDFVNGLPSTHKIVVSAGTNLSGSYTHPAEVVGKFVINTTLRQLRMPNSQNFFYRGLPDYTNYTGTARNNAYPGGTQDDAVGAHKHNMDFKKQDTAGGNQANGVYNGSDQGAVNFSPLPATLDSGEGIDTETRPINIGEIFLRRT